MISTFKGRRRTLGAGEVREFQLAISTKLRNYLHLYKGSSWTVFTCIALHTDEHGWSWPTVETIKHDTGLSDDTVYRALNLLCSLRIRGHRVMLRTQTAPAHIPAHKLTNKRPRNFYLIFPSREEIEFYERDGMTSEKSDTIFERSQNWDAKNKTSEKSDTIFAGQRNIKSEEDRPSSSDSNSPHTHTQETPSEQPELFDGEPNGNRGRQGVCVSKSKHSLQTRSDYRDDPANVDADGKRLGKGWLVLSADGRYDEAIDAWLEERRRAAKSGARKCDHTCPKCFGTQQEVVPGKGARRCPGAEESEVTGVTT